jgi:cupin superfamily acireductone dioxygenase involved in methionine salvage
MSLRGYSINLINANQAADSELIGVQLGRWAIARQIAVGVVAKCFKVSRMTVYSWFTGVSKPHPRKAELIQKFIQEHQ